MILISRDWTADAGLIRYGAVAGLGSAALTEPDTCRLAEERFIASGSTITLVGSFHISRVLG
jgi:hypothetical protein